jgi:hypothetical protein
MNASNSLEFGDLPSHRGLCLIDQFSVRKTATLHGERFRKFNSFMKDLVGSYRDDIVPIFDFKIIDCQPGGDDEIYKYSYDMMRLYPLCDDEKDIIDACYNNLGTVWENESKTLLMGKDLYPSLVRFLRRALFELKYKDMTVDNVMKNEDGIYFLIDIEGFFECC